MSATEDDTELRDLLIQNLENTGVLNKLKAEMRAAVFLAMEEQDKLESKSPLINENLKKCLNTTDEFQKSYGLLQDEAVPEPGGSARMLQNRHGQTAADRTVCGSVTEVCRLAASLIMDFLQVFNLDFSLSVFQPEISSLNGLDGRDLVCRELDLSELNRNCPLLLELVKRRHKAPEEPSQKQIAHARKKFDFYDKDGSGSVVKDDVRSVFTDLFPGLNSCRNMLDRFITDELRAADKTFSKTIDFQVFLGLYKHLYAQCRSVVRFTFLISSQPTGANSFPLLPVVQDSEVSQTQSPVPEEKTAPPPSIPRFKGQNLRGQTAVKDSEGGTSLGKGDFQQQSSKHSEDHGTPSLLQRDCLDQDLDDDPDEGDSFFDDPLPKPQRTYGCLSVLAADHPPSEHSHTSELRKVEGSRSRESPAESLSEAQRPGGGGSSASEASHSRNGASGSRERGFRDSRAQNDKTGSLHFDDDVEYDDDFNSHRSDLSKSEFSIGEEIEEASSEGPDNSDKFDDTTQDLSVSQLSQSHGADYMEEKKKMDYLEFGSDYEYNDTDYNLIGPCSHRNNHSVEMVVGPYIHSIICILGFVGNSLVIVTYASPYTRGPSP
ncbi:hypothetical protein L3Q82_011462 [Scortum barcoo]|uniref:Uncharacterized protein n=1 Tax=Scortum barcoo TaxID=214431 RepID=A0ACB8WA25_9TELE|nr:hypothetical protein L3Q82_011462 [Scortum barcoo]